MKPLFALGGVAFVAVLLAACANNPPSKTGDEKADKEPADRVEEEIAEATADGAEASSANEGKPPEAVTRELMPSLKLEPARREEAEPRFDIDVREAPVRAFLNSLVEGTDYNMVVHPDVEGTISLRLKDVTIPEVMQTVQKVHGYDFARQSGGYIVRPRRMQSRLFEVDYLNLQRQGRSSTRVTSGELAGSDDNGNSNDSNNGGGNNGGGSGRNNNRESAVGTSIRTRSESDVWKELERGIRTIVGSEEGRSVVVSPQSNMVVVRAMPDELREVADFLGESEASLSRQVVLEAKILEVELSEGFRSGINWAVLSEDSSGDTVIAGQTGGGSLLDDSGRGSNRLGESGSSLGGLSGDLDSVDEGDVADALSFGGAFSAAARIGDFATFIELLERQGDVQVLSSPRVSTVNNQKAVIKVGTDEFFATDIENETTTSATSTTSAPDVELAPFFSGIALDVTPQISDDSEVILHVHPTISEVQDQRKDFTVGGQQQSIPLALSTVRESDSIVRAESGQIVVIGGLMQETVEDNTAGVPLLSDLPGVGSVFEQTRQRRKKTELVILLKPQVIESSEDWQGPLNESSQRIQRMRRKDSEAGSWAEEADE